MGLLEGIKDLGIDDLSETEVQSLLKVLSKPELDGAILMQEVFAIMENFGLYDEGPDGRSSSMQDRHDEQQHYQEREERGRGEQRTGGDDSQATDSPDAMKKSRGGEKQMDLSKLD